jgi:antitoxin VapB
VWVNATPRRSRFAYGHCHNAEDPSRIILALRLGVPSMICIGLFGRNWERQEQSTPSRRSACGGCSPAHAFAALHARCTLKVYIILIGASSSMSKSGIARIFMHGRSQAVRLPLAFRMPGDRVRVSRVKDGVLLQPIVTDIDAWFEELDQFADGVHGRWPQPTTDAGDQGPVLRVTYLLDTNAVVALLKNHPVTVRKRLRRVAARGALDSRAIAGAIRPLVWRCTKRAMA